MANTTDFFTCPKRTVYQNGTPIDDTLIPTTENTKIQLTNDVVFDFGEPTTFSHVYIQHENIESLEMIAQSDLMGSNELPFTPFSTQDNESRIYDIPGVTTISEQYLRFEATPVSGQTPSLLSVVPMNLIIRFQDGAFSNIGFKPTQRTRGHHKMMKGGLRPFQGLGILKRDMTFGSTHMPYAYQPHITPDTIPSGIQESDYPGHDPAFELADIQRVNDVFRDYLEFIFSDSLDEYPDRIFKASFKENNLDESFSNLMKFAGYSVSFTVCEA